MSRKRVYPHFLKASIHPGIQSQVTLGTDVEAARKEIEYENAISNPRAYDQWLKATQCESKQ